MGLADFRLSNSHFSRGQLAGAVRKLVLPHITFSANTGDRAVETRVLDSVGRYGSQIDRIMDAVSVLVSQLEPLELDSARVTYVSKFNELARLADKVATEFQGKPSHEDVTLEKVGVGWTLFKILKTGLPTATATRASLHTPLDSEGPVQAIVSTDPTGRPRPIRSTGPNSPIRFLYSSHSIPFVSSIHLIRFIRLIRLIHSDSIT